MHAFQHILVLTDFSSAAWEAAQLGVSMGAKQVTLLHVFPSMTKLYRHREELNSTDKEVIKDIIHQMQAFCDDISQSGSAKIRPVVVDGEVVSEIRKYLNKHPVDLVIMGVNSHGSTNEPGSHLNAVLAYANSPVMVVPNQRREAATSVEKQSSAARPGSRSAP